jgi:hypothetical protein
MSITLTLSESSPLQLAVFTAARSAMTTLLLADPRVFDLSRLTLIRYTLKIDPSRRSNAVTAHSEILELKTSEAGKHHVVRVEMAQLGLSPWASVEFEIIDRKRGLKTSILHNLSAPEFRIESEIDRKIVHLEALLEKYPHLASFIQKDGRWPFEFLLLAALEQKSREQGPEIQINYHVFGSASASFPCEIIEAKSLAAQPGLIEIIQGNVLIAQVT